MGLWQAVLHFDPGHGVAFSTYAGLADKHRMWQAVEQAQRPQGWRVAEQPVDPLALAEERLWWEEVYTAVAEAIARLPARQREVMLAVCGRDGQPPRDLTQIGRQWGRQSPGRGLW